MARDHRLDFGTFCAIHREQTPFDQTVMGSSAGVSQTIYSNWERNKALPKTVDQVRAIARKLELKEELLVSIWERHKRDVEKDGPAIIMSKYAVTSGEGRTPQQPYQLGRPKKRI